MYTTRSTAFMESKLKLPKPAHIAKYLKERAAIKEYYDFLDCSITSSGLICCGTFSSPKLTTNYEVEIKFNYPSVPRVYIVQPKILYDPKIHMYPDNSLCLYYPKDNSYKSSDLLYETIIPWTSEWLIFYELFKFKGKWLGKYKRH